jgi:hypothetical protein
MALPADVAALAGPEINIKTEYSRTNTGAKKLRMRKHSRKTPGARHCLAAARSVGEEPVNTLHQGVSGE